ncbi:LOW QUALITY PROTEIN: probable L-type lectin-domain containing receptor kinase I.5 [Jatropha curcas]|uniref:LOW QUALITY PROTEIN: probable L-type lectin-domain containing receptor kinase I.5 n=1 Tax=Jatropha curcas TaxID=180498 RepID=UPI0018932050|nr:LOW QUALITY PROTEIN: probable L-type lectin-domain containing receptor kinase I.5 [Jatropha curcas]
MAKLVKLLIILLAFLVCSKFLALSEGITQFIYNDGFIKANLSLNGIAKVLPNGLLELTNTSHRQIGHAFFHLPLQFNNNSDSFSFSTNFVFFVFAMVPETLNGVSGGGHGIAFIISPSTQFKGAVATEFLGLFNAFTIGLPSNHLLAIELDTVKNLEFGDINDNHVGVDHVGVDVNNLTSIESAPASYLLPNEAKNKILALNCGDPIQVWIDYNQTEKLVNVSLAPLPIKKPEKPLLSTRIDLSSVFLDSMYVGFSASTGSNYASHHYILGWSFNDSGQARKPKKLGLVCTHHSPAARPTMRQVLQYLDGNATLPDISLVSGSYTACTDSISFVASTNDAASYSLSDINSVLINGR